MAFAADIAQFTAALQTLQATTGDPFSKLSSNQNLLQALKKEKSCAQIVTRSEQMRKIFARIVETFDRMGSSGVAMSASCDRTSATAHRRRNCVPIGTRSKLTPAIFVATGATLIRT